MKRLTLTYILRAGRLRDFCERNRRKALNPNRQRDRQNGQEKGEREREGELMGRMYSDIFIESDGARGMAAAGDVSEFGLEQSFFTSVCVCVCRPRARSAHNFLHV